MRRTAIGVVVVALGACGGSARRPPGPRADAGEPGAALIGLEEEVWRLEGMLVAHADAALRTPEARATLGAPDDAKDGSAEAAIRAFLRAGYPLEIRTAAAEVLRGLDADTRRYLDRIGKVVDRAPDEIMLEYLTYDGLFDLAAMRHGYRNWKAGRYQGDAQRLADSFFADSQGEPSSARGIEIVRSDGRRVLEISVFGGRLVDEIQSVEHGAQADQVEVVWRSNYEQLRESMRGGASTALDREIMSRNGEGYGASYQVELREYLRTSTTPWASVLYLVSVDEAADLFAGIASGGDLEPTSISTASDGTLPREGTIGAASHGVTVRVGDIRALPTLGTDKPTRHQFVIVAVEIESSLDTELRLPSSWFSLETPRAEYPEVGVLHPSLSTALAAGAQGLELPYRTLAAGGRLTLALLFDLPPGDHAVLHVGSDELRLDARWTE